MTVGTSTNIHFDEGDAWHRWHPGDDKCAAYGALKFGDAATLYFGEPALIDEVIAELVALRAEMVPEPKPPAHVCECGHFEAYHVGAVLSDEHPGQCTECDYGTCERFRPAAGKDEPASPDAAEALIDAIVAGTPMRTPGRELCDSTMPLPRSGGELKCTLDDYHDGAHSAIAGKYRWLGTGMAARTEDGQRIAKAEPVKSERPFDAGEGTRELSGPGRELLATAIADEDAASAS